MKMKIYADDVRKAAKKAKVSVTHGVWFEKEDCGESACPLGTLFLASRKSKGVDFYSISDEAFTWANNKFGEKFVNGFIEGYDSLKIDNSCKYNVEQALQEYSIIHLSKSDKERFTLGYINGRRIAMAKV